MEGKKTRKQKGWGGEKKERKKKISKKSLVVGKQKVRGRATLNVLQKLEIHLPRRRGKMGHSDRRDQE